MLAKLKERVFPCQKTLTELLTSHAEASKAATQSALKLIRACEDLDDKFCGITAPYKGQERRLNGR